MSTKSRKSSFLHKYQQVPRIGYQTPWTTCRIFRREDIESATDKFISYLQQAAHLATPIRTPQRPSTTLPLGIKRLVAMKRRGRAKWQQSHVPDDRRLYNIASNKLKTALRKLRKESFANYMSLLLDATTIQSGSQSNQGTNPKHHSPNSEKLYTAGALGQKQRRKSRVIRKLSSRGVYPPW